MHQHTRLHATFPAILTQFALNQTRDRMLLCIQEGERITIKCSTVAPDGQMTVINEAAIRLPKPSLNLQWIAPDRFVLIDPTTAGPVLHWYTFMDQHCQHLGTTRWSLPARIIRAAITDTTPTILFSITTTTGIQFGLYYPARDRYRLITPPLPAAVFGAWHPTRQLLAVNAPCTAVNSRSCGMLYDYAENTCQLIDRTTLDPPNHTIQSIAIQAIWHNQLAIIGTNEHEETTPAIVDQPSGQVTWMDHLSTNMTRCCFAPDGRWVLWSGLCEADWHHMAVDRRTWVHKQLTTPQAVLMGPVFCHNPRYVLVHYQTPQHPPAIGRYDLETATCTMAYTVTPGIQQTMRTQHRWIATPHTPAVPAFTFTTRPQPAPTLIYLHGGPHAHTTKAYSPLIRELLAHGINVVAPNVPGSTGYGRTYERLSYNDWGGADVHSVLAVAEVIQTQAGGVLPLALYGVSYGAYLALLAAGMRPDLWHCVIAAAPVTDLWDFYTTAAPAQQRTLDRELGTLLQDRSALHARSPIYWIPAMQHLPLLLIHGAQDTICPISQSRQFAAMMRQTTTPSGAFEYHEIAEMGHTLYAEHHWLQLTLSFLQRYSVVPPPDPGEVLGDTEHPVGAEHNYHD